MNNPVNDAFGGAVQISDSAEFTIVGIPFDKKSTYRTGSAGGPDAVRKISTGKSLNSYTEAGVDLAKDTVITDFGNIPVENDSVQYFKTVEQTIAGIAQKGIVPVCIGGDHSITFPVVQGIKNVYKELSILWFDAHPDIYPEYEGDLLSHACPLSRILELGGISSVFQGGIRATTSMLNKRLSDAGVKVFTVPRINEMHGLKIDGPVYMSVDIDVLDPAFAPGTGTPVPGGISTRELINLILSFDFDIVGFDLVEVNPEYDHSGITAAAGAKIIMETIGRITKLKSKI